MMLKHCGELPHNVQTELEFRCRQLLAIYDVPCSEEARKVVIHVILIARSPVCWVFDLEIAGTRTGVLQSDRVQQGLKRAEDFTGAVCHCLINGLQHSSNRDKLGAQLSLAIKWQRPDVLHYLLRKNIARTPCTTLDGLMHQAIQQSNEKAVVKLLEVKFVVFKLNSQSLEASMLKWFSGAGADD